MVSEELFSRKALPVWIALILALAPTAAAVRPVLLRPIGYWPMLFACTVGAIALLRPLGQRWLDAARAQPRPTIFGTVLLGAASVGLLAFVVGIAVERFHFVLFSVLGILLVDRLGSGWRSAFLALVCCGVVSTVDELIQAYLASRVGDIRDVGLNLMAASVGILFMQLLRIPARNPQGRDLGLPAALWILLLTWFMAETRWGYTISMPGGSFFSAFSANRLIELSQSRNYVLNAPAGSSDLLALKDRYFIEGIERLRQRNDWVQQKQWSLALFDNAVLELYYSPVLDARAGHWTPSMQHSIVSQAGPPGPIAPLHGRDGPNRPSHVAAGVLMAAIAALWGIWPRRKLESFECRP